MLLNIFRSKIHRATVTEANLNYVGSITIDALLLEASGILPHEKVQVVDIDNGERFETYVIEGERGSGQISLNGAAARKVAIGDKIIIIAYALMSYEEAKSFEPKLIFPDNYNQITQQSSDLEDKH